MLRTTVVYSNGTKIWLVNGKNHRLDGPAYINPNGTELWWLNDILVDGEIYKKIQNSSKEELLFYMVNPEYKYYLSLIEYRLNL